MNQMLSMPVEDYKELGRVEHIDDNTFHSSNFGDILVEIEYKTGRRRLPVSLKSITIQAAQDHKWLYTKQLKGLRGRWAAIYKKKVLFSETDVSKFNQRLQKINAFRPLVVHIPSKQLNRA